MLKNIIEDNLDPERAWDEFMSGLHYDEDEKKRYQRINPKIGEKPPALDETSKVPHLQGCVLEVMGDDAYQQQVGKISRQLVASSFYIECSSLGSQREILGTVPVTMNPRYRANWSSFHKM